MTGCGYFFGIFEKWGRILKLSNVLRKDICVKATCRTYNIMSASLPWTSVFCALILCHLYGYIHVCLIIHHKYMNAHSFHWDK